MCVGGGGGGAAFFYVSWSQFLFFFALAPPLSPVPWCMCVCEGYCGAPCISPQTLDRMHSSAVFDRKHLVGSPSTDTTEGPANGILTP